MTTQSLAPRKTRKEILAEWRQGEILDAARRIFARLGYSATNIEDIAKEAEMAKGTFYLYFKSKEEVFAAVLAHDLQSLIDRTIEGMSDAQTFDAQLTVFFDLRIGYLKHNQDFLKIYFAEFDSRCSRSALISDEIDQQFQRGFEFMRSCLEQAIARKEIREVPLDSTAYAIFDLARGFAERHLRGWSHLPLEEDAAFTHSMILNGLKHS